MDGRAVSSTPEEFIYLISLAYMSKFHSYVAATLLHCARDNNSIIGENFL